MLRRASFIAIIVALLGAGTLPVALAQNSRYQQGKVRRVKACVGIIGTMGEPNPGAPPANPFTPAFGNVPDPDATNPLRSPNPNPYLFYVLDQRKDVKPDGLEIYNPAALPFPSTAQVARWSTSSPALTAQTPLKPDMGAYWEVLINQANYDRLAQMDVIYIPIGRRTSPTQGAPTMFTEEQRRVLTRLADSGVTIWVDWALDAATMDGALGGNEPAGAPAAVHPATRRRNAFFTNVDFAAFNGNAISPSVGHPLLTSPFVFQPGESIRLGKVYQGAPLPSQNRAVELRALDLQPTTEFTVVVPLAGVAAGDRAYVAAARFGAGHVVATAGNVGGAVSGFIPFSSTTAGNADLTLAELEDLKFAYNLFAWSSEVTTTQKNSRHTGQSSVALDGMIEQSNYPHLVQAGSTFATYPPGNIALPANPAAPLVVNGVVVAAVRTNQGGPRSEIAALEANPNDDFDGNSYIDDPNLPTTPPSSGLVDYSIGQNYDCVDRFTLGPQDMILGMTLGELPDPAGGGAKSFVFAGGTFGLLSLPTPRPGQVLNWNATAQVMPTAGMAVTGAPAFALNPGPLGSRLTQAKLYVGGVQPGAGIFGKVAGLFVNPNGGMTPEWYYPPRSEPNRLGAVSGSLTTAQLMDTGTGAVDTMVFATTVAPTLVAGAGAGQQGESTGGAYGWVTSTRGDPLAFPTGNAAGGGANPTAGRRFTSARWVNLTQGRRAPDPREITWDVNRHHEVRVMDKGQNYVLARFVPGTPGFNVLTNGATGGQVELPEPIAMNGLNQFSMDPTGRDARLRNQWNLNDFVLVADYSLLPLPLDTGAIGEATMRPRFTPATPFFRATANSMEQTGAAGGVAVGKDNLAYYATGKGYMCAVEWKNGRAQFRWKILGASTLGDQDLSPGSADSQNVDPTNAAYLDDYRFVASPAAGNRVVFTSRSGTAYIFEPDATIRFKLTDINRPMLNIPWNAGLGEEVVLEGDHGQGILPNNRSVMSRQTPFGKEREQFVVDPDTGTATFLNMENFALDLTQAISPDQAFTQFGVDTGGRPAVPIRWWFRTAPMGQPSANTPATALVPIPLVAVYKPTVSGEGFFSGAVLTNDKIFIQGTSGWLHELPLDPKTLDPSFPRRGAAFTGLTGFNLASFGLRRMKNVAVGSGAPSIASPAVTEGMLITNTPRGLTVFGSPNVVIADSNRIVEASGNSTALASTDVVTKHRMDISEFAIPTDPGFANTTVNGVPRPILTERKPISRAAVVKKLDRRSSLTGLFASSTMTLGPIDDTPGIRETPDWAESSYLVADAGNNRIIEFNPAGKAVWECDQIFDPMDYIPAGEPLKLSQPMDVQRWVEREIVPGLPEPIYVIHTLIADTGNNRIVEVVDKVRMLPGGRYGPDSFVVINGQNGTDGQPFRWYHVVVWASQTNAQGLRLRYRSAQRVFWPDLNGDRIPSTQAGAPNTTPMVPTTTPPYLPAERFVSYVMATVQGQQLTFPGPVTYGNSDYFRRYGPGNRAALERKPTVASGPDSIVFLRDHFRADEETGQLGYVPNLREPYPAAIRVTADEYRFAQGVIDPTMPIISRINDEAGGGTPIHNLNGVGSVQLTVRTDVKFAPWTLTTSPTPRLPYLLIADTDGVWETRLVPGAATNAMAWAFTIEDYAYVTGAGNGNPAAIYSTNGTDHSPGGRRLSAVSARRLPSGLVLITSRMPATEQRGTVTGDEFSHQHIGADVFMLRSTDFRTLPERNAPYNRADVSTHGWQADLWVQTVYAANVPAPMRGAPSIRWRAAEALDPAAKPTLRSNAAGAQNPAELTGSYIPAQPNYADLAY